MSSRNYHILIQTIEEYRRRLTNYSEEKFIEKKQPDIWSPAEVYAHIISANRMTVKSMNKVLEGKGIEDNSSLTWSARLILLFERFPKGRKVPEVVQKRTPQFLNIKDAKDATEALLAELAEIWKSHSQWSPNQKLKHPVLGLLNNHQWIKFMKIHSKHHLKQLDRISN
jgi:DinB superfamily